PRVIFNPVLMRDLPRKREPSRAKPASTGPCPRDRGNRSESGKGSRDTAALARATAAATFPSTGRAVRVFGSGVFRARTGSQATAGPVCDGDALPGASGRRATGYYFTLAGKGEGCPTARPAPRERCSRREHPLVQGKHSPGPGRAGGSV